MLEDKKNAITKNLKELVKERNFYRDVFPELMSRLKKRGTELITVKKERVELKKKIKQYEEGKEEETSVHMDFILDFLVRENTGSKLEEHMKMCEEKIKKENI